jgi:flagellar hook assembly protein FlgD
VLNKSTITDVMNWPNPFSTATHFVFTLTGSEMPTFFKIQIMTITGKLVREIDLSELGTIHIGRNITDYAWDGKDQYGDQLANGIYLYRVVTNIRGERIEKRESDASKYFTKEFGKMCLIR